MPNQTLQQSFAANLKKLRVKQKLSQEKLARKADVSTSFVSMLERCQRTPALDTVELFAEALNVPALKLLA